MTKAFTVFQLLIAVICLCQSVVEVSAWNVVLAGGTGPIGQGVAAQLCSSAADAAPSSITILTRNAFLAATPNRVTEQYGWVGPYFLNKYPDVKLRDWDGGDLLDIVGQDWIGWQDDCLPNADVIVHLVGGGFTDQRVMACERLVRESLRLNRKALHITVSPTDEDLPKVGLGVPSLKKKRIEACEAMVQSNCPNHVCLRIEAFRLEKGCNEIVSAIRDHSEK